MKAFISREQDSIRVPYARKAQRRPRMTVFCGSVNDVEFLTDASGSRRFWPVEVDAIARDWGLAGDVRQVWAQARALWLADPIFELTADEDRERAELAESTHQVVAPEVDRLDTHWERHGEDWENYCLANPTDICLLLGIAKPSMVEIRNVRIAMVRRCGKARKLGGKQRCWPIPIGDTFCGYQGVLTRITATEARKYAKWR